MGRHTLIAAVLLLGLLSAVAAETGSEDPFSGYWRQVESNAGQCATCSLTVSRADSVYRVVASNGWSVAAKQLVGLGEALYAGGGLWERTPPPIDPARRVAANFVVKNDRLHMTLTLTRANGTPWRITAVFEREIPMV